jgi:hypothetical protein
VDVLVRAGIARAEIQQIGADNVLTRRTSPIPPACRQGRRASPSDPTTTSGRNFGDLDIASLRKILPDNAARIYHLD